MKVWRLDVLWMSVGEKFPISLIEGEWVPTPVGVEKVTEIGR